jgi:hypothetical protein
MKNNTPKKQHYIPQFLLNRFAKNSKAKTKQVYVFDKQNELSYINSIKNVGCKNGCYDFAGRNGKTSLEPCLQYLVEPEKAISASIQH